MMTVLFSPKPFTGNGAVNQRNSPVSWQREVPDTEIIFYDDAESMADANATHTGGYNHFSKRWTQTYCAEFPLRHPSAVVVDRRADAQWEKLQSGLLPRTITWIGSKSTNATFRRILSSVGLFVENKVPALMSI